MNAQPKMHCINITVEITNDENTVLTKQKLYFSTYRIIPYQKDFTPLCRIETDDSQFVSTCDNEAGINFGRLTVCTRIL